MREHVVIAPCESMFPRGSTDVSVSGTVSQQRSEAFLSAELARLGAEESAVPGELGGSQLTRGLQDRESRPERNAFRRPDGADAAAFSSVLAASRQRLSENARSERTGSKGSLLGSCATAEPAARVALSRDLRDGANRAGIAYLVTIQWISDDCSARARASASYLWAAARSQSAVRSRSTAWRCSASAFSSS